jgi:preprotein translocase subunit SecD
VSIELNAEGGRKMRADDPRARRQAHGRAAEGKGQVHRAAGRDHPGRIRLELPDHRHAAPQEAAELALLLRAGALSAPMEFVEERVVGPQLGAENISRGLHSTVWGFVAIAIFMIIYYQLFGFFSVVALACNLLFLLAILSTLHVTLTLPGIAAIALALGMAIDANVLINERIREELRVAIRRRRRSRPASATPGPPSWTRT